MGSAGGGGGAIEGGWGGSQVWQWAVWLQSIMCELQFLVGKNVCQPPYSMRTLDAPNLFFVLCSSARCVQQPLKGSTGTSAKGHWVEKHVQPPSWDLQFHTGPMCPQEGHHRGQDSLHTKSMMHYHCLTRALISDRTRNQHHNLRGLESWQAQKHEFCSKFFKNMTHSFVYVCHYASVVIF